MNNGTSGDGREYETDYYAQYTSQKLKEARGVFSRYGLALFLYTAVAYAVVLITEAVLMIVLGIDGAVKLLNENVYLNWLLGVGPMYLIGFPVFFLIIKGMKTVKRERERLKVSEFLTLFLMCEGVMFVGNVIGQALNGVIGAVIGNGEISNSTSELIERSPVWLVILVAVVIGPVIEELLFRKLMIDRLSRYGDALAITVSAIAFGLFHGNLYQFFYAAFIGFIFGYVYTRTGNIAYTIAMHIMTNFFGSVAVLPIIDYEEQLAEMLNDIAAGLGAGGEFFVALSAVGSYMVMYYTAVFAGLGFLVYYIRNRKFKTENRYCEYRIPSENVAGTVLLNVGAVLFLVTSVILCGISLFS